MIIEESRLGTWMVKNYPQVIKINKVKVCRVDDLLCASWFRVRSTMKRILKDSINSTIAINSTCQKRITELFTNRNLL